MTLEVIKENFFMTFCLIRNTDNIAVAIGKMTKTLEEAQENKIQHIIKKLNIKKWTTRIRY